MPKTLCCGSHTYALEATHYFNWETWGCGGTAQVFRHRPEPSTKPKSGYRWYISTDIDSIMLYTLLMSINEKVRISGIINIDAVNLLHLSKSLINCKSKIMQCKCSLDYERIRAQTFNLFHGAQYYIHFLP